MELKFKQLSRKFKVGATELADPLPGGTLNQVQELIAQQFPPVRHTCIFESDGRLSPCGGFIVYDIKPPPVKTQV